MWQEVPLFPRLFYIPLPQLSIANLSILSVPPSELEDNEAVTVRSFLRSN